MRLSHVTVPKSNWLTLMSDIPEQERLELMAAIGEAAMSSVDNLLVHTLSLLLAPPTLNLHQYELASIIIFRARSLEQRLEIFRDVLELRLRGLSQKPRHSIEKLSADFVVKAFNVISERLNAHKWIRNLAAHGNVFLRAPDPPKLVPTALDVNAWRILVRKRPQYNAGITAKQILEECKPLKEDAKTISLLAVAIDALMNQGWGETFRTAA